MIRKVFILIIVAVFALFTILYLAPYPAQVRSQNLLLTTDVLSIVVSILTIYVGYAVRQKYGGIIGDGVEYILAGIVAIGAYESIDIFYHLNILVSPLFARIGESTMENVFISVGLVLMGYGLMRMRLD